MNRRTFFKVVLGTVGVLLLDPIKVLSEQPQSLPKQELDFKIDKVPVTPTVHVRKDGLEIKSDSSSELSEFIGKDAKIIDLVRISYPAMIAQQLCSVQPMTQSTGEIFKIRYVPKPWYKRMMDWFKFRRHENLSCQ